jgi:protein TonB
MYAHAQHSGRSTRLVGAITAAAMTAGVAYFLATGMNLVRAPKVDNAMEMVLIAPPEPPPPVKEPEPPKVDVPPTPAPPPELVAPDIPFVPEDPPVITAPIAEATPVPDPVPVAPAPPSGNNRSAPKLRAGEKPAYPVASVRAGEQGTTHLEVCVSTAGRVTSVQVAGSSGSSRLDDAAAKWIRNERFAPGMIDGVAQNMCGHDVYYEWNLKDART